MKNIIVIFIALLIVSVSCQKDGDPKKVSYMITGLADNYSVVYLDADGKSVSKEVNSEGLSSKWTQDFTMDQGSPVYLYLKFKEDITSNMSFSMGIIIDGKYEYQAKYYEKTIGDTIFEVKRGGVVPFD
jgi:gamma-glutamyl-gamma-aminobutyrate hydrolase PuuD